MSDIFISYSSKDRARAKVLAGALERQGWSVWWDRKIPPGRQFSQVIKEAMDEARCIIVLWSKESVKSEWVQNEASEGARRKILVPALIDDVEIPFEFRRIQAARLVDWEGRSTHTEFDILLEALCAILGQPLLQQRDSDVPPRNVPDHSKPTDLETEKGGSMSQKTKVLAAICIVTLIAIISTGIFLKYRQSKEGDVVSKSTYSDGPHAGWVHPGCVEFRDLEEFVSKGPITKVEVAHGGFIYGIRLYYGRDGKGEFHLGPKEYELREHGIKGDVWLVPDDQRIVRIEGEIFEHYISWLKFITNKNRSWEFGEKHGGRFFEAAAPNDLPLRTISGHVNTERKDAKSIRRAVTSMTFHFGY